MERASVQMASLATAFTLKSIQYVYNIYITLVDKYMNSLIRQVHFFHLRLRTAVSAANGNDLHGCISIQAGP